MMLFIIFGAWLNLLEVWKPWEILSQFTGYFFNFLFYIGVSLINNVVFIPGVQQSDSGVHIHVSILFQFIFPFMLLNSIEQSSLCYTVCPC